MGGSPDSGVAGVTLLSLPGPRVLGASHSVGVKALRQSRLATVVGIGAMIATAAAPGLLAAPRIAHFERGARADDSPCAFPQCQETSPLPVPPLSGIVEVNPTLASSSRGSPATPQSTRDGTTAAPAEASAPTFGVDVRVNQDAGTKPQNEPSIAVNRADPSRLAAGANDYRCLTSTCGDTHPGVYRSTDGGISWADAGLGGGVVGILPEPPGFAWGSRETAGELAGGDPTLAWGPGTDVYYGFIAFNDVACSAGGIYVSRSADAGATWATPVQVQANSDSEFQDKPYVAVDSTPGSPFFGRIYVSWTRFESLSCGGPRVASPIVLSYSDDGAHWSSPRTISTAGSSCNQGSIPAIGADGSLYVAWWNCDITPQRILVAKSVSGGESFSVPSEVAQFVTIPSPLPPSSFRTNSYPTIATHPTDPNLLYVVWASDPAGDDDADILSSRSTDGGATWSIPTRVNDDATTNDQFFPWVSVSPEGRLDVIFGDRRDDPADSFYNTYHARSTDGGLSFQANVRVTDSPSNPDIGFDGLFIGDYFNLVSGSIHPAWTDTRNGHQDIFSTVGTEPDTDGDGCTDAEEATMGFDPSAWHDFYDVPVPARADPTANGGKDRAVSLGDVLAVLFYAGTSDNGGPNANWVDYDSDKNGDTVEDGTDYDRTASAAPNPPWNAGPPDGAISLTDLLAALAQVSLHCTGAP